MVRDLSLLAECCDSVVNTSSLCAGCIVISLSCCGEGLDILFFAVRFDSVLNNESCKALFSNQS